MKNIAYLLALHSVDGLGPIRLKNLLDKFDDPKEVWQASLAGLKSAGIPEGVALKLDQARKGLEPEKYLEEIQKAGILWVTIFDPDYPKLLKVIYSPPVILYFKGKIKASNERAIAVVGTRKITSYGKLVTEKFVSDLVAAGVTIISGLARGVDTEAHWGAVRNNGRTIAVLGGGLKKIFPPENSQLAEKIAAGLGAVVSEFPPDYPPLPGNFPSRNRIISGLSLAVLVTEAAEDSGSLITAKLALDQGRDVFAVPGPITSELSKGPSVLIKQGAKLVTEAGEILVELGIENNRPRNEKNKTELLLSDTEKAVLKVLENENKHIDEICRQTGLPISQVSATLIKMEIVGLVKNMGGVYTRNLS